MSMKKKSIALVLAGILACSSVFTGYSAKAEAADSWVTTESLTDNDTAAPAADEVKPDANQYEYQKQELSAFCHFGPNTFNEIEWGENYGDRLPDDIFRLEDNFDEDTLVKTLKEAGFKKLIITAKHHDGFCIWNSAHTTYDVESTSYAGYNYDEFGGDILAEISAACTKYDMDMGLYLSPWDIHEPSYGYHAIEGEHKDEDGDGDAYDYNDFYNNQLEEILSNPKYGNKGHFNEVWMDGAKGSGDDAQDYDFQRWFATIQKYEGEGATDNEGNVFTADCMLFGAEAYTGVRWIGNEAGLSNEETWSKSVTNKTNNTIDSNNIGHYHAGFSNGNQWTVPETDSRITSGWFWGRYKNAPATMTELANRYFASVGYNSVMLLNIPPNNEGTIDDAILARVAEFGDNVELTFDENIAKGATVKATQVRGNDSTYSPANVIDGNIATYWTVEDGTASGSLLLDLGSEKTFDVVSIEESIEFGQRITSFTVEYSTDGTNWTTMAEGSTIGAKRLCRTAPVKAQYLRITVNTNDTDVFTSSSSSDTKAKGTVPMIAEVGVYKASDGFELASAAPDGMTVIDDRDSEFTFTGSWTNEAGAQFPIDQTSKWCNAGASFTVDFTGSKIYLVGTVDPNHGTANVSIGSGTATSINTYGSVRQLGQVIYESPDLEDGNHTLTLTATGTIGIDGAYVINNGGVGMIGIEEAEYTMEENSEIQVKLIRTGGTESAATVLLSPNPGSAIQDDYDTECITEVTFAPGETEKTAPVKTRRNTNRTGDQYFTMELSTKTEGLILGLNSKAKITITDADKITEEKLQELVNQCTEDVLPMSHIYTTDSWSVFERALTTAEVKLDEGFTSNVILNNTYEALEEAKEALVVRTEAYSADDRFQFPNIGETKTLEAEFVELHNDESNDTSSSGSWPMVVADREWASNGKIVDAMGNGDYVVLYYNAPRTGTYTATVTYRSGNSANGFSCAEADGKIAGGSVTMGANDEAQNTHTGTIEFKVVEAGEGELTITGGSAGGPQLDKIVIEATDLDLFTYNVTKTAGENGTIAGPDTVTEGDDAEFRITPEEGYEIADVTVNGRSVGAVGTYTVEDVNADITIAATFVKEEFKYSAEDPFVFPSEVNTSATLEAEYATLHNSGDGEQWPLEIKEDGWASNGKFVNSLNSGDSITIPYKADQAGTYSVTVTYRSGSPANYLAWSSTDNKITAGTASAGNGDAGVTKTATFDMVVAEAGEGVLTFAPTTADSPQLDKFDITLTEITETPEPTVDKTALQNLYDANVNKENANYTEDSWTAFQNALNAAKAILDKEDATQDEVNNAKTALEEAIEGLEGKTEEFTGFVFPATLNETKTLEAETAEIVNDQSNDNGWPMKVENASNASGAQYIDAMNYGDSIKIPYKAEKAGTYEVVFTYSSGNSKNKISWSEEGGKINGGQVAAGADNAGDGAAPVFKTVKFEMEVVTAGTGTLIITPPDSDNGPRLDKFDITLKEITETPEPTVDKTALQNLYDANVNKENTNYTEASWTEFQNALNAAKAILDKEDATQDEVNNAKTALEGAIAGLETNPVVVDKTALQNLYDANVNKENTNYTEASWTEFQNALNAAKAILDKEAATQDEVNDAKTALEAAINELELKETTPTTPTQPKPEDKPTSEDKTPSKDKTPSSTGSTVQQSAAQAATTTPTATGDSANTAVLLAAVMFAAVVIWAVEKRKRNTI